jgi:ankyrin repeat protein
MRLQQLSKAACVGFVAVLALPIWLRAAARAPIADAAERRDASAIHTLLKQGADVSAAQPDGMTALHWSALHGDTDLASMLLFAGANVRATTRLGA